MGFPNSAVQGTLATMVASHVGGLLKGETDARTTAR
jgi:hypothetical protein